jgi:hypothetical protein
MINKISLTPKINLPLENSYVSFNFLFVSLFSPYIIGNTKLVFANLSTTKKKILLKESYMVLSWFYYLKNIEIKRPESSSRDNLKFFVMPTKQQIYTLTLAPVAHKKWSREQYKFHYYFIKVSFNNNLIVDETLDNLNQMLLFILITKKRLPSFETNLFFLKNIRFFFSIIDNNYFNYYNFIQK